MEAEIIKGDRIDEPARYSPALLDTSIPMYAAGISHPYKDACQWVMTEIANGRLDVAIDTEMIQAAVVYYKPHLKFIKEQ